MENVLSLFPGANSVVVAAIDGLPFNFAEFQLSNYIRIVHRNDVIDAAYLGLAKISGKPEYYIVGVAEDERYRIFPLEITNAEDACYCITYACSVSFIDIL